MESKECENCRKFANENLELNNGKIVKACTECITMYNLARQYN